MSENHKIYIIGKDALPERISVEAGQSLNLTMVVLPGVSCDESLQVELVGQGASVDIGGLYLCQDNERVRLSVDLVHKVGSCRSDQLFKGVVGGSAKAEFSGRITVVQDAQKTQAFQNSHSLLLGESATAQTSPQLEIYADDVQCSHGATVGKLDEDEQFYMRSRGITLTQARFLQVISFVAPVMERIPQGELKDSLMTLIENAVSKLI